MSSLVDKCAEAPLAGCKCCSVGDALQAHVLSAHIEWQKMASFTDYL